MNTIVDILSFLTITIQLCNSSNILAIISTPSLSHNLPFRPLWKELLQKGHTITILTTYPINDPSLVNLTEINLNFSGKVFKEKQLYKKLIEDEIVTTESVQLIIDAVNELTTIQFQHPDVQTLLKSNQTFDLIIAEAHFPAILGFVWKFRCPWIGISSFDVHLEYQVILGNPIHPVLNVDHNFRVEDSQNLTFSERLFSFVHNFYYLRFYKKYLDKLSETEKIHFGNDMPHLKEIQNNVSMVFVTTHVLTHDVRPLNPNTIPIGSGVHIGEPKALSKDLKTFLDQSTQGVIYFCFGNTIGEENSLPIEVLQAFLNAFSELPYQVLMKIDFSLNIKIPENVKIQKWVPQQDVLRHQNIKLFITHGGLQSLQESIYNGVPLIVCPLFGDGFFNANNVVRLGIGKKIKWRTLTKESLKSTIIEVIESPVYSKKAQEVKDIFRDEEISGVQRAVYWTEYVIRHRGARHLRNPALDMPFWKYYMLDVFGFLIALFLITIIFAYCIIKFIIRKILIIASQTCRKVHND